MNRALFLIVLLFGVSCGPRGSEAGIGTPGPSREEVIAQVEGDWVSKMFIDSLLSTRAPSLSPYQDIIGFGLSKEILSSASPVLNGYTEHEGGYTLRLCFDSLAHVFAHYPSKEDYSFMRDTVQIILVNDKLINLKNMRTGADNFFLRMPDIDRAINASVIAGTYDEAGKDSVVFSADGQVTGFAGHPYYNIKYDFTFNNLDEIYLYRKRDSLPDLSYHFRFLVDTLLLYEVEGEMADERPGKLVRKLVLTN